MKYVRYYLNSLFYGNPSRANAAAWLFADAASASVFLIGAIPLTGYFLERYGANCHWMYDGWFPNSVAISPQASLGFVLAGCALLFVHRSKSVPID